MSERILFVDDEASILEMIQWQVAGHFDADFAEGPENGLRVVQEKGPYAVVVSDMSMPGTDGATFLSSVRDLHPDTVRLMLTGTHDLTSVHAAINRGGVYRFLTKPCASEALVSTIEDALRYHRLLTSERELLERTLRGAVEVMAETLGMANPDAFSRASRLRARVARVAEVLGVKSRWEMEIAALLSQLGCVTLSEGTVAKLREGRALVDWERRAVAEHPRIAERLIGRIPRLERVARMVGAQLDASSQVPSGEPCDWDPEVLGAQVLRVVGRFDDLVSRGAPRRTALEKLLEEAPPLPYAIVKALEQVEGTEPPTVLRRVSVSELTTSMVLAADVRTTSEILLARKGQALSDAILVRLAAFARGTGIREPIEVLVPLEGRELEAARTSG